MKTHDKERQNTRTFASDCKRKHQSKIALKFKDLLGLHINIVITYVSNISPIILGTGHIGHMCPKITHHF